MVSPLPARASPRQVAGVVGYRLKSAAERGEKNTRLGGSTALGWGAWIRTKIHRSKVWCAAIAPRPKATTLPAAIGPNSERGELYHSGTKRLRIVAAHCPRHSFLLLFLFAVGS
jgi:hypothetical protein